MMAGTMAASTIASGGCYSYTPIDVTPSAVGADVRVRLTDAGSVTLAPYVGNRIELIDGRVSAIADTAVTLSVTGTTDRIGTETSWRGEQVTIPRAMVAEFGGRSINRRRSFMAGGIAAGLVAVVGVGFGISGSGGGGRGGGTGSTR
jgi:hypothetical protein